MAALDVYDGNGGTAFDVVPIGDGFEGVGLFGL